MNEKESQFLKDFISNKYLSAAERKKAVELAFKELGEGSVTEDEKTGVKLISENKEGGYGGSVRVDDKGEQRESKTILPAYLDPRGTAQFLLEFDQNIFLKSTSHLIDSNLLTSILKELNLETYSFEAHQNAIVAAFNFLSAKFYNKCSDHLRRKINSYIKGNDVNGTGRWSEEKIKYSWSCKEIKIWSASNPSKVPNPEIDLNYQGFKIDRLELRNGEKFTLWNELVLYFKRQIKIRYENNLRDLIAKWIREWNKVSDKKIDILFESDNLGIQFFTDVEKLEQLVKELCKLIAKLDPENSASLNIRMTEQRHPEKAILLTILHENSVFRKSLYATLDRPGQTFSDLISNQINGLCDWNITAEFLGREFANIQVWPRPDSEYQPIRLDDFKGVQYEFKFYIA